MERRGVDACKYVTEVTVKYLCRVNTHRNSFCDVRFEVFTAVTMNDAVFWGVTPW
jgi:hypothetical protein